jgi:hypothetical protein
MRKLSLVVAACLAAAAHAGTVTVGGREFNLNIPFCGS